MFTDNRTTGKDGRLLLPSPYIALVSEPAPALKGHLLLGVSRAPGGGEIGIDSLSLLRNQERWLPVMGEFHYARYPHGEWRDELLKMKAGGIGIVATYVFWIHHEEIEGEFDWSGRRSLRDFVELCGELGLLAVVRCGPWCHGECRNGGLPDWILAKSFPVRSNDSCYLSYTARLYREIARQIDGLLWKDGGPVIGIQCENEYGGPAEHLLTLKKIAIDAGIDVPLYTRTGWPKLATPMPMGEFLPLFGGYPDGFWDRSLEEMPPAYQENYSFRTTRIEVAAGADLLGVREAKDDPDTDCYPYFACEIGGGMMTSYHRRIRISPKDIESLALAKIGSGNNLQGYYMFHGGTNPEGRLSTLQESQATGYWNDLPVKTYDFQAPLGEFGQVREHYHRLRRLHLFLADFGRELAAMPIHLPEDGPMRDGDISRLRWSVRSDGHSGFLFVNNYQRLRPMPAREDVRFDLRLAGDRLCFPWEPISVPAGAAFVWPFNLDLEGARMVWATAQPICRLDSLDTSYVFFSEIPGIAPEFVIDPATAAIESTNGSVSLSGEGIVVKRCRAGNEAAIILRSQAGARVCIVLLDDSQSLACWKGEYRDRERVFLTQATLLLESDNLRLQSANPDHLSVAILPAEDLSPGFARETEDGLFRRYNFPTPLREAMPVSAELLKPSGNARPVRIGSQRVAEAPGDLDFEEAAVWSIALPGPGNLRGLLLRMRYAGDVARLYLDGELLVDNFYNGGEFEVGLDRYAPEIGTGELLLKILPLRRDAPIYLPKDAWPDFGESESVAKLFDVELVRIHEVAHAPASP